MRGEEDEGDCRREDRDRDVSRTGRVGNPPHHHTAWIVGSHCTNLNSLIELRSKCFQDTPNRNRKRSLPRRSSVGGHLHLDEFFSSCDVQTDNVMPTRIVGPHPPRTGIACSNISSAPQDESHIARDIPKSRQHTIVRRQTWNGEHLLLKRGRIHN